MFSPRASLRHTRAQKEAFAAVVAMAADSARMPGPARLPEPTAAESDDEEDEEEEEPPKTHTDGLSAAATARRLPLRNSYSHSFNITYSKEDVFKELTMAKKPLGVDLARVRITVTKSWVDPTLLDELEIGCVRHVAFLDEGADSKTSSELVRMEQDKLVEWDQVISTTKQLRMVGNDSTPPSLVVTLADGPRGGTTVTLLYTFETVETPALFGKTQSETMPEAVANQLTTQLASKWAQDMRGRGYTINPDGTAKAPKTPAVPTGGGAKRVVKSQPLPNEQKRSDPPLAAKPASVPQQKVEPPKAYTPPTPANVYQPPGQQQSYRPPTQYQPPGQQQSYRPPTQYQPPGQQAQAYQPPPAAAVSRPLGGGFEVRP